MRGANQQASLCIHIPRTISHIPFKGLELDITRWACTLTLVFGELIESCRVLCAGYEQRRILIQWMRRIPHLCELPEALATFFTQMDGLTPAQVRGLDLMSYLDDKITDRVGRWTRSQTCCTIVYSSISEWFAKLRNAVHFRYGFLCIVRYCHAYLSLEELLTEAVRIRTDSCRQLVLRGAARRRPRSPPAGASQRRLPWQRGLE